MTISYALRNDPDACSREDAGEEFRPCDTCGGPTDDESPEYSEYSHGSFKRRVSCADCWNRED